jgi:hypothetical protein
MVSVFKKGINMYFTGRIGRVVVRQGWGMVCMAIRGNWRGNSGNRNEAIPRHHDGSVRTMDTYCEPVNWILQ